MKHIIIVFLLTLAVFCGATELSAQLDLESPHDTTYTPPGYRVTDRAAVVAVVNVDVGGRQFEYFKGEEAENLLLNKISEKLTELKTVQVVDRILYDRALKEVELAGNSGYLDDGTIGPKVTFFEESHDGESVSLSDSDREKAEAGQRVSADYLLTASFTSYQELTEVTFKFLEVETLTYPKKFRFKYEQPFSSDIKSVHNMVSDFVADLAKALPLDVGVVSAGPPVVVAAGRELGVSRWHQVEFWSHEGTERLGIGSVVRLGELESEVELEQSISPAALLGSRAYVMMVPNVELALGVADRLIVRGRFQEANKVLAPVVEENPKNSRAYRLLGRSFGFLRKYHRAIECYRAALRLTPEDTDLLNEMNSLRFEVGQYLDIVSDLEPRKSNLSLTQTLVLGQAYEALDELDKAESFYRFGPRAKDGGDERNLRLAVLALKRGQVEEAQREFRLALRSGPKTAHHQVAAVALSLIENRGTIEGRLHNTVEGLHQNSDFASITTIGEIILYQTSDCVLSASYAENSISLNPKYLRAHMLDAFSLHRCEQTSGALMNLGSMLETDPYNLAVLLMMARIEFDSGNYESAKRALLRAGDIVPDLWQPVELIGDCFAMRGEGLEAVTWYVKALRIAEKSSAPELNSLRFKIGKTGYKTKTYSAGQLHLEACIDEEPAHMGCRFYLGLYYFDLDRSRFGKRAIVQFEALEASYPDGFYYLGRLYDWQERFSQSKLAYQNCVATSCSFKDASVERIDQIESVFGRVLNVRSRSKEVEIEGGLIQAVSPGQEAVIVGEQGVVAKIRVERVKERTSIARILKGKPNETHFVRFRPSRPKDLKVRTDAKRGLRVAWRPNVEPEVSGYLVFRSNTLRGPFQLKRKVNGGGAVFHDKTAQPSETHFYQVVAVSQNSERSLPSRSASLGIERAIDNAKPRVTLDDGIDAAEHPSSVGNFGATE